MTVQRTEQLGRLFVLFHIDGPDGRHVPDGHPTAVVALAAGGHPVAIRVDVNGEDGECFARI